MIAILAGKECKLLALACAAHDSAVMLSENHLTGVCLFLSCRRIFHWQGVLKFKPRLCRLGVIYSCSYYRGWLGLGLVEPIIPCRAVVCRVVSG